MVTKPEQRILRFLQSYPTSRNMLREVARLRRLQAEYSSEEAERIVLQWAAIVAATPPRKLTQIERIVKAQKARMNAKRASSRPALETGP